MKWINIKDQLPPKETPVLVYYDKYMDVMEFWYDDDEGKHIFFNPPHPLVEEVSHWMPMPKPPEEK
jgi:hypothetical protein